MSWIKKIFLLVLVWFRPKQQPSLPAVPQPQANRSVRRRVSALERARRKHDKFVTPQGEPPAPRPQIEREKKEAKPLPAEVVEVINDAEQYIVERHHTGGPEDVLYRESEFYGEYNFRDTILEQLDRYFVYIARMKRADPQSYAFYKQLGATLVPYLSLGIHGGKRMSGLESWAHIKKVPDLPPYFNKHRPAFGCYVYGANPFSEQEELKLSEDWRQREHLTKAAAVYTPKFMYFLKYEEPPPEVQPMSGGDIYKMTIFWDRPHDPTYKRKSGSPEEYSVFVSRDGEIKALRMCETQTIEALKKKHKSRGGFYLQIPQRAWRIPNHLELWAKKKKTTAQIMLGTIFCDAVQLFETSNYSMVRIAVKKGDTTAVFGVNHRRLAYFFKDRDYVLGEHGGRRQVFHMVRGHERHTKNGASFVKFHFRGERHFTWAGYQVDITVPGRDHLMLPEIDIGSSDSYWHPDERGWLDQSQFADSITGWMKQGITLKERE